jgi:chromosome segregation ATPase
MAQKKSAKPQKATLDKILSTVERGFTRLEGRMERGFAAVAEDIADIKSKMVTKAEFNEAVEKLDDRLTAVESKIGGIHNRIDDEALKRANLETRVRSAVPNLPPPPERV